jgi:hypothetical protein
LCSDKNGQRKSEQQLRGQSSAPDFPRTPHAFLSEPHHPPWARQIGSENQQFCADRWCDYTPRFI